MFDPRLPSLSPSPSTPALTGAGAGAAGLAAAGAAAGFDATATAADTTAGETLEIDIIRTPGSLSYVCTQVSGTPSLNLSSAIPILAPIMSFAMTMTFTMTPTFTMTVAAIIALVVAFLMALVTPVSPLVVLPSGRHVNLVIPAVVDEIDRAVTGAILAAMLAPVARMPGRHMQIQRLGFLHDGWRRRQHHDGPRVNDLGRRRIADVDPAIQAGLINGDGHTDRHIAGMDSARGPEHNRRGGEQELAFHA